MNRDDLNHAFCNCMRRTLGKYRSDIDPAPVMMAWDLGVSLGIMLGSGDATIPGVVGGLQELTDSVLDDLTTERTDDDERDAD